MNHIIKEGLDPRLAKLSGAIGVGVYFAESSKTSLSYITSSNEDMEIKRMFLCRVATGYSEKGNKGIRRPPYINNTKELADSVEGFIGKEKMWVVFDTHQSYPEYIIDFKVNLTPKNLPFPIMKNINPPLTYIPFHYPLSTNIKQIMYQDKKNYNYNNTHPMNTPYYYIRNNKNQI